MTKQINQMKHMDVGDQRAYQTLVARTVLLDGSVSGRRNVDSLGSILRVSAAPYSDLERMKADVT